MPETTQNATVPESDLARILSKYGKPAPNSSAAAAFEAPSRLSRPVSVTKISRGPETVEGISGVNTKQLYETMTGIQLDLADLTEEYGGLNASFSGLLGRDRILSAGDSLGILYRNLRFWRSSTANKTDIKEIKKKAAGRKAENLVVLVDRMAGVLADQHQNALQGLDLAKKVQLENVGHLKKMHGAWVDRITKAYTGTDQLADATKEATDLQAELDDINDSLIRYEGRANAAVQANDVATVRQLTDEMKKMLQVEYDVLDGKLAKDGEVSDIRRNMLASSEGVQSAKGAIAGTRANYTATVLWIDAMNELAIKYQHALSDFVPVFKASANVAAGGLNAMSLRDALTRASSIHARLLGGIADLTKRLTEDVFTLVQTPLIDPAAALDIEKRLVDYGTQLNTIKQEWARAQQSVQIPPARPAGYTQVK